jgi:hypothetical protein
MATITPIPATTSIKDSRSIINTNFTNVANELNTLVSTTGITGATGATGPTGPIGLGVNYRGLWNNGTSYAVNDMVHYLTRSYVAKVANVATTPGTDAAKWELFLDFVGVFGNFLRGTYAALPSAAANTNAIYKTTDDPYLYHSNGTTWTPFHVGPKYDPLDDSTWVWFNQGGVATTSRIGSAHFLKTPGSAGDQVRIRARLIPTPPYTVTWAGMADFNQVNYAGAGIVLYNSSNGRLLTCGIGWGGGISLGVAQWNSVTSYSSNVGTGLVYSNNDHRMFFRLIDDGTNLTFSMSYHGYDFSNVLAATTRAAWIGTPTHVGIQIDSNNNLPVTLTTLHWAVT